MAEFDLIESIRARAAGRDDIVLGIGDDAALLRVPAGHELAVTADTLNAGVHFPAATAAADIGWKALAANLSDLAAMGARPAWCTLSLSLPQADAGWVDGFLDGFLGLATAHGIALAGGDTTRGPLSIAVTAMGHVEAGAALRRDRARIGDDVWVTGTLGDAAAALVLGGHLPSPSGVVPTVCSDRSVFTACSNLRSPCSVSRPPAPSRMLPPPSRNWRSTPVCWPGSCHSCWSACLQY